MQRPLPRQSRRRPRPLDPRHPRYWPTWAGIALLWLLVQLPLALQRATGRRLGRIARQVSRRRRAVVATNLDICLPQLSVGQRQQLVAAAFESAGIGAIEAVRAWLGQVQPTPPGNVVGLDALIAARDRGRGVLLLGAHFTCMELAGAQLSRLLPFDVVYRSSSNAAIDALMWHGRQRHYGQVIVRTDVRAMLRTLRAGRILWFAADQDHGRRHSTFVPLFGVPAATVTAASKLAQQTGAAVLAVSHWRDPRGTIHYAIEPLDADLGAYNRWLERAISAHPDQYLWLHRRFKTRPAGCAPLYR